jgi:hypothetical protein
MELPSGPMPVQSLERAHDLEHHRPLHERPATHAGLPDSHGSPTPDWSHAAVQRDVMHDVICWSCETAVGYWPAHAVEHEAGAPFAVHASSQLRRLAHVASASHVEISEQQPLSAHSLQVTLPPVTVQLGVLPSSPPPLLAPPVTGDVHLPPSGGGVQFP